MATGTGTSTIGRQTLLTNAVASSLQMSIQFPSRSQPPQSRMGYFWLFVYAGDITQQHYVIETGIAYAPGVWRIIRVPPFSSIYRYRIDAVWSVPGIGWTATII